ncbi:hypothetical protein BJ165DRAFT_679512 [Panaeolus papilionaceus]|nr:hypothetical protein BJ165DRAFT_679512 [Panaeolus papilionaceus]
MDTTDVIPPVDWKNASVIVSNGRLYVSPNSTRKFVSIPPENPSLSSPFENRSRPNTSVHNFKEPRWWDLHWGWMAFVPLSPSFTSRPFESLRWRPDIHQVEHIKNPGDPPETRHQVAEEHRQEWKEVEDKIVEACNVLRLSHKISGNPPPNPYEMGYAYKHKSAEIVKKRAKISRDWFVLWMGFMSYLVSLSQLPRHYRSFQRQEEDVPTWYTCLQDAGFEDDWLESLTQSTVCDFDACISRVGVVLQLSQYGKENPPISWFLRYNIPIWFLFNAKEEHWIRQQPHLQKLIPPQKMVDEALNDVFANAPPDVKVLVMVHYLSSNFTSLGNEIQKILRVNELSTQTFQSLYKAVRHIDLSTLPSISTVAGEQAIIDTLQHARMLSSSQLKGKAKYLIYPWPPLLVRGDVQDHQLYEHWSEFFTKQAARQTEYEFCETHKSRGRRLKLEQNPNACQRYLVFRWRRVVNDGKTFYARVQIDRRRQGDILHSFLKKDPSTRRFNAFQNPPEWDLYDGFSEGAPAPVMGGYNIFQASLTPTTLGEDAADQEENQSASNLVTDWTDCTEPSLPPVDFDVIMADRNDQLEHLNSYFDPDLDIIKHMFLFFGYTPVLGRRIQQSSPLPWGAAMKYIRQIKADDTTLLTGEKSGITSFIAQLMKGENSLDADLDDLSPHNRYYLAGLYPFRNCIVRLADNLYIIHKPTSASTDWLLGVRSTTTVLLIARLIIQNPNHTLLTIARTLLEMGVPFHTLLRYPDSVFRQRLHSVPESEEHFTYPLGTKFTGKDYQNYKLLAEQLLCRPFGRAALMRGGILSRIAQQYLTFDGAVDGPSSEVRVHYQGQVFETERPEYKYTDDDLTEREESILIGTYYVATKQSNQGPKLVSWMPPVAAWYGSAKDKYWAMWTQQDEEIFCQLIDLLEKEELAPMTKKEWRDWVRGRRGTQPSHSTKFFDNLASRSEMFMSQVLPPLPPFSGTK